jgi:V8-like Glu-specific endopeptidase
MVTLTADDQRNLIRLLVEIPEFGSAEGRRALLDVAGLGDFASRVDLSGPAFVAANAIVRHLAAYGRVSLDKEALGVFLNTLQPLVGVENRGFLADVLTRYSMMVPVKQQPGLGTWRGADDATAVEEKIIGASTLRPVAFLAKGWRVSSAVAYLDVGQGRWSGTGFLVSEDLLLTNAHVVPHADLLEQTSVLFNYESDEKGASRTPAAFRPRGAGRYWVNSQLDYALFELAGDPGKEWGWLACVADVPKVGERVNIIQHPGGQEKQVSLQGNFVEYADDTLLQYVTATLPGSSGSPVFSDRWEVCAVHHAGGTLLEPATGRRHFRNEGVRLSRIREDLTPEVSARFTW